MTDLTTQASHVSTTSRGDTQQDETQMLLALRRGEERAFVYCVDKYSSSLLRLAMIYVSSQAVAEEVVQETWVGVLEGLSRFEGRSSFKTWLFRILINRAKTKGQRESRYQPFLQEQGSHDEPDEQSVEKNRFIQTGQLAGHWSVPPNRWDDHTPERLLLAKESHEQVEKAIASLPLSQRQVITYRDIEGFTAHEVCNILNLSETNQRVLLHRARSSVRRELDKHFARVIESTT